MASVPATNHVVTNLRILQRKEFLARPFAATTPQVEARSRATNTLTTSAGLISTKIFCPKRATG
jgi:hypothetical protein